MVITNVFFSIRRSFFFVSFFAVMMTSTFLFNKPGITQDCNQLPKTMIVGQNKELPLRGCTVRTYLVTPICTVALYANTQHTPDDLFSGNNPWVIRLQYMRDIGEGEYQEGWKDRFETDLKIKEKTQELLQHFPKAVNKNDVLVFQYLPEGGLKIIHKETDMGLLKDKDSAMAVCKAFLGDVKPKGYFTQKGWRQFTKKLLGESRM